MVIEVIAIHLLIGKMKYNICRYVQKDFCSPWSRLGNCNSKNRKHIFQKKFGNIFLYGEKENFEEYS
jgi:hypothetical protein